MEKEIKTLFEKNRFYTTKEICEILKITKMTISSAVRSWQLIWNNISLWQARANYRFSWENILAWLDNYSDLEVLSKFLEFYVDSNWFEKTKQFINAYFDKKENYDNK